RAARRFEESLKNLLVPGILFEEMGFRYFGPIGGHEIGPMVDAFRNLLNLEGPVLIHMVTKKGLGYKFAEECPEKFHSAPPFDVETGAKRVTLDGKVQFEKGETYTNVFGEAMIELAGKDDKIIAITAAMPDGTGLSKFAEKFPKRFFDVGIAEQHAIGFASGLAKGGLKPVCAIYSTFLQRAYDQIVHDVCLQDANVVFCLDRAGLVGEDGPTHHGLFDIAYLRHIPKIAVMAPSGAEELKLMLEFAVNYEGPISIRYPRGEEVIFPVEKPLAPIELGRAQVVKEGKDAAVLAFGSMVGLGVAAAKLLKAEGTDVSVINARFAKPLDEGLLQDLSKKTKVFITLEEGVEDGGFGSAVLEFFEKENIKNIFVKRIGLPDEFIEHGARESLFRKFNLTPEGIRDITREAIACQRSR
ncbi:MAG: 1-deoxy-D-xylulose-5-phosphate synthase, partial [Candidatus Omnitrophota bacterium]